MVSDVLNFCKETNFGEQFDMLKEITIKVLRLQIRCLVGTRWLGGRGRGEEEMRWALSNYQISSEDS